MGTATGPTDPGRRQCGDHPVHRPGAADAPDRAVVCGRGRPVHRGPGAGRGGRWHGRGARAAGHDRQRDGPRPAAQGRAGQRPLPRDQRRHPARHGPAAGVAGRDLDLLRRRRAAGRRAEPRVDRPGAARAGHGAAVHAPARLVRARRCAAPAGVDRRRDHVRRSRRPARQPAAQRRRRPGRRGRDVDPRHDRDPGPARRGQRDRRAVASRGPRRLVRRSPPASARASWR